MKADARVRRPAVGVGDANRHQAGTPGRCRAVIAVVVSCCTTPAVAPKRTTAPVWKPCRSITTSVPPAVGPLAGDEPVIIEGGAGYVKAEARVAAPPSGLVTLIATGPALPGRCPGGDRRRCQLLHNACGRAEAHHRAGLEAGDHHIRAASRRATRGRRARDRGAAPGT